MLRKNPAKVGKKQTRMERGPAKNFVHFYDNESTNILRREKTKLRGNRNIRLGGDGGNVTH